MTIEQFNIFIDLKCKNAKPLFIVIRGSQAYGTSIPTSDIDYAGVYIQSIEDIIGTEYKEQINDDKNDTVFYEIRRFLELLQTNNPTVLELLNTSEDCIIYKHPLFDLVLNDREKFITKKCKHSFGGYARQQISKSRGLNKKIVNPVDKIRKTPLHFIVVPTGNGSMSFLKWFSNYLYKNNIIRYISGKKYTEQEVIEETKYIGLSAIPNARDLYYVFYNKKMTYRGILNEDLSSNELRLTSIPKGEKHICVISANMDGYTQYCNSYKEYWSWFEKKNSARYEDTMKSGKGFDGKNMMHCYRLLDMSIEIANGDGINVKRHNAEDLLKIRRGEIEYDELLIIAENKIKEMDQLFDKSNLPDDIDKKFVDDLLIKIRKLYYNF